jgi:uncharacterized protein YjiS (DUF1127 family)
MTSSAIQQTHTPTIPTRGLAAAVYQGSLRAARAWYRRQAGRRQLASLSFEQLRDVGIDPDMISRGPKVPGDPWTMIRLQSLR